MSNYTLHKTLSGIFKIFGFWPQNEIEIFPKELNAQKTDFFYRYSKTGICIIELCATNQHVYKASGPFFAVQLSIKPCNGSDATFLKLDFLEFLNVLRQNK